MKPFAFVFPGQGSQSVGMLDIWEQHPVALATLKEANDALDENIAALIAQGPKEALSLTVNTQPAMLIAGIVAYRIWMHEVGVAPQVVAGHSLGEYAALVAAQALSFSDALRLVRFRAQAMQEAVPVGTGAMAAVLGLPAQTVEEVCVKTAQQTQQIVEAVNFNDTTQTVIAGSKTGVEAACEALKAAGAKRALLLPVSAPFHSSLMKPAADRLKERLEQTEFVVPKIEIINNVNVVFETQPQKIRDALYRQAFSPVRWVEDILAIKNKDIDQIVECGPGKVLSGLLKRIDTSLVAGTVYDPDSLKKTQEILA